MALRFLPLVLSVVLLVGRAAVACPDVRCDACVPPGQHTCRVIDCYGDITSTFVENCVLPAAPVTPPPPPPPVPFACDYDCDIRCGEADTGIFFRTAYGKDENRARESAISACTGEHFQGPVLCEFTGHVGACYPSNGPLGGL